MSDLKSCPFCGSRAIVSEFGGPKYLVECLCCDAGTFIGRAKAEDAAEDWNGRPPKQDCAEEMYEALDNLVTILQSIHEDPEVLNAYKTHYEEEDIKLALAALAKARGETK